MNVAVLLAGGAAVVVAQVLGAGADVTDDLGRLVNAECTSFLASSHPMQSVQSGWRLVLPPSSISFAMFFPATL